MQPRDFRKRLPSPTFLPTWKTKRRRSPDREISDTSACPRQWRWTIEGLRLDLKPAEAPRIRNAVRTCDCWLYLFKSVPTLLMVRSYFITCPVFTLFYCLSSSPTATRYCQVCIKLSSVIDLRGERYHDSLYACTSRSAAFVTCVYLFRVVATFSVDCWYPDWLYGRCLELIFYCCSCFRCQQGLGRRFHQLATDDGGFAKECGPSRSCPVPLQDFKCI